MTDSERFDADLHMMALLAAGGNVKRARAALDWLKNRAPLGDGRNAGWGGQRVSVLVDASRAAQRWRRIYRLRKEGRTYAQIGEEVNMSPSRVAHVLLEAGIKKGRREP